MHQYRSVFTNQRYTLAKRLAEAGLTPDDLCKSSASDPIIGVQGLGVDVTLSGQDVLVHFCPTQWLIEGFAPRQSFNHIKYGDWKIQFACPIPDPGNRYSIEAEIYFDGNGPVLNVISFTWHSEHDIDYPLFDLDDVNPADSFVPQQEEPVETILAILDLYGEPVGAL